ncbi:TRAP transporter large permease [Marinomonas sp. CT5]|uniref:TRAP transporter large permease n=1 Tax=Marinomonas sp. CT5 TaxID=2066133 RepID=UPI0017A1A43B|nr:TRAP transporter large permease [Marinomonas sp. CT5]NVK75950.1 TRAP transporter large permease [Oceanospirillaceae bacterium]QUX94618.1 TRAP transporter large permease [Marinomonas sp. CT5]
MEGILIFGLLVGLIIGGMWVQFAVASAGLAYLWAIKGFAGWKALGIVSWGSANSFTLAAIPLFILMAEILLGSGLSSRLYNGVSPFVRRLPGGLLHTNIAGSGIFAAISGGSAPTAAAMSTVALPELSSRGYNVRLVSGSLAAGGTLGILIPPSITMIIYSTFTETSIAQLFSAGLLPGILLAVFYMGLIMIRCIMNPSLAPADKSKLTFKELYTAALDVLPFLMLIFIVLGSIYGGIATPTEAGAVGVLGAMLIAGIYKRLNLALLQNALSRTIKMSGNILFIVFTSMIFAYATALSGAGETLVNYLQDADVSRIAFLIIVMVIFAILGCFMEGLGMIAIIVPVIFPALMALDINLIWFGVFVVILVELGQLTPPLGVILFVVASSSDKVKVEDVVLGTLPFFIVIVAFLFLLMAFPEIALYLPSLTTG